MTKTNQQFEDPQKEHAALSAYLESRRARRDESPTRSHWMQSATLEALPNVRNEFDNNRDPLIAIQLAELNMSEAQRRRATARADSNKPQAQQPPAMIRRDKPQPTLKPSPKLAHGPNAANFNKRWSEEQQQARWSEQKLTSASQKINDLAQRNKRHAAAPSKTTMCTLEMEFYLLERRAQQIISESQKQRRTLRQR